MLGILHQCNILLQLSPFSEYFSHPPRNRKQANKVQCKPISAYRQYIYYSIL